MGSELISFMTALLPLVLLAAISSALTVWVLWDRLARHTDEGVIVGGRKYSPDLRSDRFDAYLVEEHARATATLNRATLRAASAALRNEMPGRAAEIDEYLTNLTEGND